MDRNLSPRKFLNDEPLVSSRSQTVDGAVLNRGDVVPDGLDHALRLRLWMSGRALYQKDYRPTPVAGDPGTVPEPTVTVTHTGGAWYAVKASWIAEPEKVQGKDAAEARAAELLAEGPAPEDDVSEDDDPTEDAPTEDAPENTNE